MSDTKESDTHASPHSSHHIFFLLKLLFYRVISKLRI